MSLRPAFRTATAATGAVLVAILLSSCSGGQSPSPTESASSKPKASAAEPTKVTYNECLDGAAQVSVDRSEKPVRVVDCDGVNIITSDQSYELGAVKVLTVEASNATITIGEPGVKKIAVLGSGNTVTYTGAAPEVSDEGEGNTLSAR